MKRDKAYRVEQRERVINNRKQLKKDMKIINSHDDQNGRLAKQHPLDCGKPNCQVCHSHKNKGNSMKESNKQKKIERIRRLEKED